MASMILIKNLGKNVTEQELTELLARHGKVEGVELAADPEAEEGEQVAFVTMRSSKHGRAVIAALDGCEHAGKVMGVKPMKGRGGPSAGGGSIAAGPPARGRRAGGPGTGAGMYGRKGSGKGGGRNS